MQPSRKGLKNVGPASMTPTKKTPVKYVPSEEEAQVIKAYFLYNNFQVLLSHIKDFNTWQQISKSKC